MSPFVTMVLCLAGALVLAMSFAWALALRTRRSSWIDAVWSFSVGMAAMASAFWPLGISPIEEPRRIGIVLLIGIWSTRLGGHITRRSLHGGDDPRYAELMREWGSGANVRLFWFLQIQAAVALVLALSAGAAAHAPGAFGRFQDILGLPLFVLAVIGESVADAQLAAFRKSRSGAVCDEGLWAYSRHPNYFFEWLAWFAVAVVAFDPSGAYPAGWFALLGAALMYGLLAHVSGVPPLEAHMQRSRGEAFRDYQARVSAFWPLPPARDRTSSRRSA